MTLEIATNSMPVFGVFVSTDHVTPFAPQRRFRFQLMGNAGSPDDDLKLIGSTTVAIRDLEVPDGMSVEFSLLVGESRSDSLADMVSGYADRYEIVEHPTLGSVQLDRTSGAYTYTAGETGGADSFTWRIGNLAGWSQVFSASVTIEPLPE